MIFKPNGYDYRLKWAFSSCRNGAWGTDPDGITDVVCIRAADFDGKLGRLKSGERTLRSINSITYENLALRIGDIILEKSGGGEKQPVGRAVIFNEGEPSITSNFLARCRPAPNIEPAFINYLLLAIYNARGTFPHLKQSTGIQNLDLASFLDIQVTIPPLDTQQRIARFLDEKTARIDALIEKKRELLDRLAEKRQALITRAVTKGLNPDVPMKPSDIHTQGTNRRAAEGAGRMTLLPSPQGWPSKRLKYLATYNDEVLAENTDEDKEIDYVEISGVSLSRGVEEVERMTFGESPSRARRKVQDGDILISTVRTYLRAIATVDKPGPGPGLIASTGFCVVRPKNDVDSGFLGWAAKSEPFISAVVARSVGVSYPAINASELVTIDVPVPPLDTQRRIAQFLDKKTMLIDGVVERILGSVEHLMEYRSALITTAVKGQLAEQC